LRQLEQEVGVLIRRVRRVIGERAQAVHADLQPAAYLMLAYLAEHGEHGAERGSVLAELFSIDKGAVSRQLQQLVDLGLVERTPDPEDGRASLVSASEEGVRRLVDVADHRREWLDEQLGDWSDDQLARFVSELGRYNAALNAPSGRA